jgi:aryl-alcohol dehydrogenase-like predicted oxidoreductase
MRTRSIGGVTVSAIGLGGMPMSIEGRPEEQRSIATIHAALDAGVTLIDTADAYHLKPAETGHNERLIARALATYGGDTSDVLVATKGGHIRPGDGSWTVDGSPAHLREAAEASLKALGVDAIGLYQFHRPDPGVPYEESIGALKDLLDAGKIRLAGISNATIAQIDTARRILGGGNLASVQNQFSPAFRSSEAELRHCADLGIAFLPWSPLGGIGRAGDLGAEHSAFQETADDRRPRSATGMVQRHEPVVGQPKQLRRRQRDEGRGVEGVELRVLLQQGERSPAMGRAGRGYAHEQSSSRSGEGVRTPTEPECPNDPPRSGIDLGQRSGELVADPQGMRNKSHIAGPISDGDRVCHDVTTRVDPRDSSVQVIGHPYRAMADGDGGRLGSDGDGLLHLARCGIEAEHAIV